MPDDAVVLRMSNFLRCSDYNPASYGDYGWGYQCGEYGYDCIDPEAPSVCSTDSPTPSPAAGTDFPDCLGYISEIGDGFCDYSNNNEECAWDGGECTPKQSSTAVFPTSAKGRSRFMF